MKSTRSLCLLSLPVCLQLPLHNPLIGALIQHKVPQDSLDTSHEFLFFYLLLLCNTDAALHLLLLLLSRFSRVQLCVTPETAAHQAPPSMGFSRQECWSGVSLPSPFTTIL